MSQAMQERMKREEKEAGLVDLATSSTVAIACDQPVTFVQVLSLHSFLP